MNEDPILHDDIREIQRLLEDSYNTGFPILKELIQNASDAKATMMSIEKFDGFGTSCADHPLLQKHPSLLIYNNGDFKERDSINIRYISGDGKANDSTVVGKFGLGLKSIFHLCDIFFYVSRLTDGSKKGKLESRQFNPWIENPEGKHSEWQDLSKNDHAQLEKNFEEISKKCHDKPNGDGFLLVVPLKTAENDHITENNIFVNGIGEYFGPYNELNEKIIRLLPMLNNISPAGTMLKEIIFGLDSYSENITYDPSSTSFYKTSLEPDFERLFEMAEEIQKCAFWPKRTKAPSCETAFSLTRIPKTDQNVVYLYLDYAVFLPLERIHDPIPLSTRNSYSLVLHGQFAIDSGRRGIKHFDTLLNKQEDNVNTQSVDEAYKKWNQFIAQVCMYPYILKILEKSIHDNIIDKNDVKEVFSAIKKQFQSENSFVLKKYHFARTYQNSWELFDSGKKVYLIVQIDKPLQLADVFRDEFDDGKIVVFESSDEKDYTFLSGDCFGNNETVIENLRDDLFLESKKIEYLIKYIGLIKESLDEASFKAFFKKIKNNFNHTSITEDMPQYNALVQIGNCFNELSLEKGFAQKIINFNSVISDVEKFIIENSNLDTIITSLRIQQPPIDPQEFVNMAKCLESKNHYGLFSSLYQRDDYDKLESILAKDDSLCIIKVENISPASGIPEFISLRKCRELVRQNLLIKDTGDRKFAKLYQILANNPAFCLCLIDANILNRINEINHQSVPNSDMSLILSNLDKLETDIDNMDFEEYKDQLAQIFANIPHEQVHKVYRLPIHKIHGKDGFHSIKKDNTFRISSQQVEFPGFFPQPADICLIDEHNNQLIREKEINVVPELSKTESIKLYFRENGNIKNREELEWLLGNIDVNEIAEIKDLLRSKYWIPVDENIKVFVRPVDIFGENIIKPGAITEIKKQPYGIKNVHKESDIDKDYRQAIIDKTILRDNFKETLLNRTQEGYRNICKIPDIQINSADELQNYTRILCQFGNTQYTDVFRLTKILYDGLIARHDNEEQTNKENIFYMFFDKLPKQKDIRIDGYIAILNEFGGIKIDDITVELYSKFFEKLLSFEEFSVMHYIKNVKLPSKSGKWQDPSWIIYDPDENVQNVSPDYQLDGRINDILKKYPCKFSSLKTTRVPDENELFLHNTQTGCRDKIDTYFKKWEKEEGVNKYLVGLFLLLCRHEFYKTAKEYNYLNSHKIDLIKTRFGNHISNINEVENDRMDFKVRIYRRKAGFLRVSLGGEERNFSELFDYDISSSLPTTYIYFSGMIKGINNDTVKGIIIKFITKAYLKSNEENNIDYDSIFNTIMDSNAIYLKTTQNRLFREIFPTLKYLSLANDEYFKEYYNRYQSNYYNEDDNNIYIKEKEFIHELKEKILNENTYQKKIRDAIVRRIKQNQYNQNSILYELFQNADDAFLDRINQQKTIPENQKLFVLEENEDRSILIRHFGRVINEPSLMNSSFNYDLENILSLNASYKNFDENKTGKFGLGFKTVYLVCDEPIIRSGDLHVKILGGFYPDNIEPTTLDDNETRIELNLNEGISFSDLTGDFRTNAGLLAAFGKSIHHIKFTTEDNTEDAIWVPKEIYCDSNYSLEIGKIDEYQFIKFAINNKKNKPASFLFNYDEKAKMVIPIDDTDNKIAKIWNTTPLLNGKTLDFAINTEFYVDVGRKTVIHDETGKNSEIVEIIGKNLGNILLDIHINKSVDINVASIFDIIIPAVNRGDAILKFLPIEAIRIFFEKTNCLPNGLTGFIKYNKSIKLFYCPDSHKNFGIKRDQAKALDKLTSEYLQNNFTDCFYISYQAYQTWPENVKAEMEIISITDIFDILSIAEENRLSPEILNDFTKIEECVEKVKTRYNFDYKLLLNNNTEYVPIYGILNANEFLSDKLSPLYSEESLSFLNKYFGPYLYRTLLINDFPAPFEAAIQPTINDVYNWWKDLPQPEKQKKVETYYETIFPDWYDANNLRNLNDESKYNETWFSLFAMACFQQMGRYQPEQHRGFLKFLYDNGLKTIANSKASEDWTLVIRDIFGKYTNDQKFNEWIKFIPQLYIIRYYFDDYILILNDLDKIPDDKYYELEDILKPAVNPILSGKGINVPALSRSLRLGASFIIREILINKRQDGKKLNDNLIEHAFMPTRNNRITILGQDYIDGNRCSSKELFTEIRNQLPDDADLTFDGYFDIPISIYAAEKNINIEEED
jgi:hypothetical protein